MNIECRLRELHAAGSLKLPFPGRGATALRHRKLCQLARTDLPLARLAESHTDATAILAEAGRNPKAGTYGVWAAQTVGMPLSLISGQLNGKKMFCTGAGLLDRALVAVDGWLIDLSLREARDTLELDQSSWRTAAFAETQTATVTFTQTPISEADIVGENNWYVTRPGFWHGACGPAACWAGGAMGLFDYAVNQHRDDAHTLAHLAAMRADVWALIAYLDSAGTEIDDNPNDAEAARVLALTARHLIEQAATDILQRLGRAYGPRPLAFDDAVSKRYQEVELYIRQSHAERDLEEMGRLLLKKRFTQALLQAPLTSRPPSGRPLPSPHSYPTN